MPSRTRRMFKSAILPPAILIASLSGGMVTNLLSPQASAQPTTAQAAQTRSTEYRIPAGSLDQVLNSFAAAAGIHLAIDSSLTVNLSSPGLNGSYSVAAGFSEILSGTNLLAGRQSNGAYVLQKKAENAVFTLPPVKVFGEVRGTKLLGTTQEVNVSVELLDSERINRERIVDLSDIFLKTPNLSGNGGDNGQFSIRGIGRLGFAGRGTTANVYIDGAPLSGESLIRGPVSLWDVQQAEVLRGSQSSVQGRNALAGAIVINTNDPTFEPEAKARLTRSGYNTTQAALAISGPLIKEQLAARLSLDYQDSDGFVENVIVNQQADRRESLVSRGKLLFRPAALPEFESKLTVDHSDSDLGESSAFVGSGQGVTDAGFSDFDFLEYKDFGLLRATDTKTTRIISESSYRINNNWLVRGIITDEDTDVDRIIGLPDDLDAFGIINFVGLDNEIFTTELRAEFNFESMRGLFGAYYFALENNTTGDISRLLVDQLPDFVSIDQPGSVVRAINSTASETENIALFGQVEWDINEKLTLNFGLRYDRETFDDPEIITNVSVNPESCMANVPGALVGVPLPFVNISCETGVGIIAGLDAPAEPAPDETFEAWLPRLSLTYNLNDHHSIFIAYQRGYRAGGANTFLVVDEDSGQSERKNLAYDPEYLDTFEIGARSLFFENKLLANINLFHSTYEDQQVVIIGDNEDSPFNTRVENAAATTLYGAELLLDYSPSETWNLYASIGILRTEFDNFPFATSGEFANLAGNQMPNAPELTYTLGASYYSPNSGFFASATYSYIDEQYSDPSNLDRSDFQQAFANEGQNPTDGARLTELIDSRSDLTMRLGYESAGFTVYAFGSNLLNDESITAVNYGSVDQNTGQLSLNDSNTSAFVNRPRTLGVGVDISL